MIHACYYEQFGSGARSQFSEERVFCRKPAQTRKTIPHVSCWSLYFTLSFRLQAHFPQLLAVNIIPLYLGKH